MRQQKFLKMAALAGSATLGSANEDCLIGSLTGGTVFFCLVRIPFRIKVVCLIRVSLCHNSLQAYIAAIIGLNRRHHQLRRGYAGHDPAE